MAATDAAKRLLSLRDELQTLELRKSRLEGEHEATEAQLKEVEVKITALGFANATDLEADLLIQEKQLGHDIDALAVDLRKCRELLDEES